MGKRTISLEMKDSLVVSGQTSACTHMHILLYKEEKEYHVKNEENPDLLL